MFVMLIKALTAIFLILIILLFVAMVWITGWPFIFYLVAWAVIFPILSMLAFVPLAAYLKIRRLGYFPTTAVMLVLSVLIVSYIAASNSMVFFPQTDGYWYGLEEIGVWAAFAVFGCTVLVRKLPKRNARV